MRNDRSRILVALDGSEQAFEAARYVSLMLPPARLQVTLFHVMSKVPESFWDVEANPAFRHRLAGVKAWEIQQEKNMREYMERARQLFLDRGVSGDHATVNIQARKVGFARDIVHEAEHGYDAVVMGSRGMSELKDLVLGSIANKLIGRLVNVPAWVVSGVPKTGKILVGMDSSEGAMRAVDHVARIAGGTDTEVTMVHVIRSFNLLLPRIQTLDIQSEYDELLKEAEERTHVDEGDTKAAFQTATNRLVKAGVKEENITSRIMRDVSSRAGAIVKEAEAGGYGTIVVGRRGLSRVEEFFMGRVSSKVLHLAKQAAVWVVS